VLAWPQLKPYVMGPNVMVRLAQRRVWEHKNLWLGCVKCIQMTSALAYPFVLQLPSEQLADVLERIPGMKVGSELTRAFSFFYLLSTHSSTC
jgi:hypothetical protein